MYPDARNGVCRLRGELLIREHVGGDFAEVPDDTAPGKNLQGVVGDVDFPPEKTLAGGGHEVMVVVVPAFAEGQQRQEPVVLAGVVGFVAARTEQMGERIDGKRVVPEKCG